jgi:histidinol dehydrogenase
MLARLDLRGFDADLRVALTRAAPDDAADVAALRDSVAALIGTVHDGGDSALRDLTERFDGVRPGDLRVHKDELQTALDACEPALVVALEFARDQILSYHEAQREYEARHERMGVHVQELVLPIERAGCYVPGGLAAYPSTVLMTVVPAKVAGVPEVVVCTPPGPDGDPPAATLAAAAIAGADEVYRVGGVQAIAGLAYGTESIRAVDVIVGPGNRFVTEAKRQVFGVVGIDSLAGTSELVVVADTTSDARLVAADLLAQAEHGPGGQAVLVTWHETLADEVDDELRGQLAETRRRAEAEATLASGGRAVLVESPEQAMAVANAIAPEHLQLMCAEPERLVPLVHHAGAVFVGEHAPAVVGDYVAGVNHVLPTGAAARYQSALRVTDFQKHVHVVRVDRMSLERVGPFAVAMADAEGLDAHARSIRYRIGDRP